MNDAASAISLNSILSTFVAERVSLQKRCEICKGTNDKCDICIILRHKPLRERLEATGIRLKQFKDDIHEDDSGYRNSFLTGSYARKTGVRPPKDVDFFLILDEDRYGTGGKPTPLALLTQLHSTLANIEGKEILGFEIREVKIQHRSVRVVFEDGFHVDIIPAFETNHFYRDREVYEIPDKKLGRYIQSNPKIHGDILRNAVSDADLRKLRDIIKLARRWNRDAFQGNEEKPKSFHLEMVAIELLKGKKIDGYLDVLEQYFAQLPEFFSSPRIPDPACPDQSAPEQWIDAYLAELTIEQRTIILGRIHQAHNVLKEAKKLEAEDRIVAAIEMLRTLYPDLPQQDPEVFFKQQKQAQPTHSYANSGKTSPWNAGAAMV